MARTSSSTFCTDLGIHAESPMLTSNRHATEHCRVAMAPRTALATDAAIKATRLQMAMDGRPCTAARCKCSHFARARTHMHATQGVLAA
eukprot:790952-Pyramimonas_sp.AAC.1